MTQHARFVERPHRAVGQERHRCDIAIGVELQLAEYTLDERGGLRQRRQIFQCDRNRR